MWGVELGCGFCCRGYLKIRSRGKLKIGNDVVISSDGWGNWVGGDCTTRFLIAENAQMIVGDRCGISNSSFFCSQKIQIGSDVFIGGGCRIYDTDFHPLDALSRIHYSKKADSAPVEIKDKVWLGAHCTILKGVTVGSGAVIGACSLVTKSVPADELWAGVPARKIRNLNNPCREVVKDE